MFSAFLCLEDLSEVSYSVAGHTDSPPLEFEPGFDAPEDSMDEFCLREPDAE